MPFLKQFPLPDFLLAPWKKKQKTVQRSVYDTDESIARLLKQLQQHLVIMTARFPDDKEIYNTAIIKVDYKNKLFYLDELVPDTGNEQLKKLREITLQTRLDGAIISARCTLKDIGEEKGITQYIMHFPQRIRSTQRRESYRVNIPLSQRIQVNIQTEAGAFISGFLNDISFNGIAVRLEGGQNIDLDVGDTIPFLTIHLKETIACEMEITRISRTLGNIIISGHLEEISREHQRFIQKFITKMDRKKRKQNQI